MIGQADTMAKAFSEIAKAVILAIIMIYMVLAAEFESFMQPLVIMMSLPFAIIGAVLGLMVAGQTANMMSLIGLRCCWVWLQKCNPAGRLCQSGTC